MFILSFSLISQATEANSQNTDQPLEKPLEQQESANKGDLGKTSGVIKDTTTQDSSNFTEAKTQRDKANYFVLVSYSPVDMLIPSKGGITVGLNRNADRTWELEYLRGSISVPFAVEDLGKMSDERISIISRSYFGNNSFNFSYGLSYLDFSLHLGDKLLNRVTGGSYPSLDLVKIQSLGFNVAIGNRWIFKHDITMGIDWITWTQPVHVTKKESAFLDYASNENDKDDVGNVIGLISYMPRFALLKLQLGILF